MEELYVIVWMDSKFDPKLAQAGKLEEAVRSGIRVYEPHDYEYIMMKDEDYEIIDNDVQAEFIEHTISGFISEAIDAMHQKAQQN